MKTKNKIKMDDQLFKAFSALEQARLDGIAAQENEVKRSLFYEAAHKVAWGIAYARHHSTAIGTWHYDLKKKALIKGESNE